MEDVENDEFFDSRDGVLELPELELVSVGSERECLYVYR
jgi:hypothetical protein